MRIGVDCQALQTAASRERGIGLYTRSLLKRLCGMDGDEYHLFFNSALAAPEPSDFNPYTTSHSIDYVQAECEALKDVNECLQRLTYERHNLDLLYIASPQEGPEAVIESWTQRRPFPIVSMLYDLIPLVFPDAYLVDPVRKAYYEERLELYRTADVVVALSAHSRRDLIERLGIPQTRVVTIGAAADPAFRVLDPRVASHQAAHVARQFGIRSRFILFTGGLDFRKNMTAVLQAFSLLPPELQRKYQLVIVCALGSEGRAILESFAERYGIKESLVLTNQIPQTTLVTLYNACELFVFPSLYEGFGLPVLEAMSCGAPVVASNTSSIPEVLGDAGIAVDPADPRAIALAMRSVLESPQLARELREKSLQRAQSFSWDATAAATREAFSRARTEWLRSVGKTSGRKPKLAFFSPLPPVHSGISDYSAELLPHLTRHFEIDAYVDGYPPNLRAADSAVRFLPLSEDVKGRYFSWLYQLGNNPLHAYMFDTLIQHHGISVLHELSLHGMMHHVFVKLHGSEERYGDELEYQHGAEGRIALELLQHGDLDGAIMTRLFPLNDRVLAASKGVIVHSKFARDELLNGRSDPLAARVRLIPQGISIPALPTSAHKQRQRMALELPPNAIVIGVFGLMTPAKQLEAGLRAFARLHKEREDVCFLGVGEFISPQYEATVKTLVAQLGVADRVRFTGYVSLENFYNNLFACDVVLSLRNPSAGETSAAMLRALSCGTATIVTDTAAFSELPDDAVVKLALGAHHDELLIDALRLLTADQQFRQRLGSAARRYAIEQHSWPAVAAQYADFIHYIEGTGLGDQTEIRNVLGRLAENTRSGHSAGNARLNRSVSALAANEGLGRVVWV